MPDFFQNRVNYHLLSVKVRFLRLSKLEALTSQKPFIHSLICTFISLLSDTLIQHES